MQTEYKGTPGPWSIEGTNIKKDGKCIVSAYLTKRAVELIDGGERIKGESWIEYWERTAPEREKEDEVKLANAKLVCAAPELLEQLKTANKWIKLLVEMIPKESDYAQGMRAGIERMEKVIKKATE